MVHEREHIPLMGLLGLEGPEDPALRVGLEGLHLAFDEAARVIGVRAGPVGDVVLPAAGPDVRGARVRAVVARAPPVTIEVKSAVCHRCRPLADEGPFVGPRVRVDTVAHQLPMLPRNELELALIEHLIVVVVERNPLDVVVGRRHEAVVARGRQECVLQYDGGVADLAHSTIAFAIELSEICVVQNEAERLVQQLDADHHVVVAVLSVLLCDRVQHA